MKRVLITMALCAFAWPGHAQTTVTYQQSEQVNAFSGQTAPLTVQLKNLDASWRRFSLSTGNDIWGQMARQQGIVLDSEYFTQGKTISVGSETLLIAYRFPEKLAPIRSQSPYMPSRYIPELPLKLSPESSLQLALVNPRGVVSLNSVRAVDTSAMLRQNAIEYRKAEAERTKIVNVASASNLRQIGESISYYKQRQRKMPSFFSIDELEKTLSPNQYGSSTGFRVPGSETPYALNTALSNLPVNQIKNAAQTPVIYEPKPASDGTRGVLFANGQVRRVKEAEFQHFLKQPLTPTKASQTVALSGAAALYYVYKNQNLDSYDQQRIFLSASAGRLYRRNLKDGSVEWITPPKKPIIIPAEKAAPYRDYQGYNGRKTGKSFGGYGSPTP